MNLPNFSRTLLPLGCAILGLLANAPAMAHLFTTMDGQFIDGEVASAKDGQAVIRSIDGRQTTIGVAQLVSLDRKLIENWTQGHSTPVNYSFDVTWAKEKVGSKVGARTKHVKETRNTYVTHITILNKGREQVDQAMLHYQLYYNMVSGKTNTVEHRDGIIKLSPLPSGASVTVDTDTLDLDVTELAAGRYYSDGAASRQSDSFRGIAATLTLNGKQIYEYLSNGVTKASESIKPKSPNSPSDN